jgi:acyl-CoA reductase-like NAD-dependent aldehyde dehydrogenase
MEPNWRSAANGLNARPGFYMVPALLLDVDNSTRISRAEIFGPVSAIKSQNGVKQTAIQIAMPE